MPIEIAHRDPPSLLSGKYGVVISNADRKLLLSVVHIGPSAGYRGTVRIDTQTPIHACTQTARLLAAEIIRMADYVDRLNTGDPPHGQESSQPDAPGRDTGD